MSRAQTFLERIRQAQTVEFKSNGGLLAKDMAQPSIRCVGRDKKQDGIDLLGAWFGTAMKALNAALPAGLTRRDGWQSEDVGVPAM